MVSANVAKVSMPTRTAIADGNNAIFVSAAIGYRHQAENAL